MAPQRALPIKLAEWLDTPAGVYVRRWEQRQVDAMVSNAFGYHAIQIGLPQWNLLQANRIPNKAWAHSLHAPLDDFVHEAAREAALDSMDRKRQERRPAHQGGRKDPQNTQEDKRDDDIREVRRNSSDAGANAGSRLVCEPEHLPFENQSIDLMVLPHTLEYCENPHQVLREVERVLMPEGRVVITGFNPFSLWGLRESLPGLALHLPVSVPSQVSLMRLKDWFKLLSFEPDRGRFGCYVPLCQTHKWLLRWRFMELAGDRWWPVAGAVYAVSAVKRVAGMRLLGPAWRPAPVRSARAAKVAPAVNRVQNNETGK